MTITIYEYAKCSTCRKAIKFLDAHGVTYRRVPIVEQPPAERTLRTALARLRARGQDLKHLFNTSGERYRVLRLSARLKEGLSDGEAIGLLAADGKLIKRPVLITTGDAAAGFEENIWSAILDAI